MQKKNKKIIILTVLVLIMLSVILLIANINKHTPELIAKQTIDNYNYTTEIGDYTYDITNCIQDPKDIKPTISAGMIPIKREGEKWIIADRTQADWYDYSDYKPAYMMLNDGVYQSELVRNMEQNGKKLANENLGVEIKEEELGTIYVWIPRFEYISNSGDLVYIKQECTVVGDYRTFEMFMSETDTWDYSYAGIWFEYEPLASETALTNKVNRLNSDSETYGLLANTKAYKKSSIRWNGWMNSYIYALSGKYMNINSDGDGSNIVVDLEENNSAYRTILRVTDTNKLEPIKATAHYDAGEGKIKIEVTHNKNEIKEILLNRNEKLDITTINGKITASTEKIETTGQHIITIVDVEGNSYECNVYGKPAYATLYTDGTLGISTGTDTISGKVVSKKYGDIQLYSTFPVWQDDKSKIRTVNFVNKIQPVSTEFWFYNCTNLTKADNLVNIVNFDTSRVINMNSMFSGCSGLTSLDLSSFDTSKVTNMSSMFSGCRGLTSLNLSNFDTSRVTNMNSMFSVCSGLTSLNLSNFDTSRVTNMNSMFYGCSRLTSLNLSNFDTSRVIYMNSMFFGCSGLTNLDLSSFDTSRVTDMTNMFYRCSGLTSLDLSSFDTSNVINMINMFNSCTNLKTIYVGENWKLASNRSDMFTRCGTSTTTRK